MHLCVYMYGQIQIGTDVCVWDVRTCRYICTYSPLTLPLPSPSFPTPRQLLADTEAFHRKLDPLIDERILMLGKGEEMPDDPLTVMVKEKVRRGWVYWCGIG